MYFKLIFNVRFITVLQKFNLKSQNLQKILFTNNLSAYGL